MAQIRSVVSESLEAQIRTLLPSQSGFTEDLQASNVIMPVVDITSAAEGSSVPEFLQTAWDDSTNLTQVNNGTVTVVSTTGFYKVDLHLMYNPSGSLTPAATIQINDGTATRIKVWQASSAITGVASATVTNEDSFIVFLRAGRTLEAFSNATSIVMNVWTRQVADVNGNLVNPLGFTPQ
jgi:hypothetical protein